MTWSPLLDGARRERALAFIEQIASRLLATEHVPIRGRQQRPQRAALMTGWPGQALAHAYLARAGHGEAHAQRAEDLLERTLSELDGLHGDGSLSRGLAGVAFVLEHLTGDPDGEDTNADVDEVLLADLDRTDPPLDLMLGVVGRAVYARERLSRPTGRALYAAIVDKLFCSAMPGPFWRAVPDAQYTDPDLRRRYPAGWIDLGPAHGLPGIVAALARAPSDPARALARGAMAWLWTQQGTDAGFPALVGEPALPEPGWCYGDLGTGAVLCAAAHALDDATWRERWLEVIRRAARHPPVRTRGLGLCHGAAGNGHVMHRIAVTTGDEKLRTASIAWYETALELLEQPDPERSNGFLDGLAGVVLALVAATSDVEPTWDRLLLLS
jgi:lantibiotic biosynthesis protein